MSNTVSCWMNNIVKSFSPLTKNIIEIGINQNEL